MNRHMLGTAIVGGFLISSALAAEPLKDLRDRLAALRSDRPIRIRVDVEIEHQGKAPLHLNRVKEHGKVVVVSGQRGVEVREQKRTGSSTFLSFWQSQRSTDPDGVPMVGDVEARDLIDPAELIERYLSQMTTLADDQAVTWEGQPARLLVIQPPQPPVDQRPERVAPTEEDDPKPVVFELRIWLGADGSPLALESTQELRLPVVTLTHHQTLAFQQLDGRLLVARARDTFSGTALAVLHGTDVKTMTVTVE